MRPSLIFLFILLFGAACKKESLEPTVIVANIEKEFALGYVEKFSASGRHLQFNLVTLKEQPCGNYFIQADWQQSSSMMKLNINGLEKNGPCAGNAAFAKGSVVSEVLADGIWPIDVNIQNIIRNPGKLMIQKGVYQLVLESSHGVSVVQKDLRQIPSGTLWGYVSYKPEYAATARFFLEELKKISKNQTLEDGDYGYFNIQNNVVKYKETPSDLSSLPILRGQNSNIDLILNLVNNYRKNYKENIFISLFDTNGLSY